MGQVIKIRLSVDEREELAALVGRPTEEAGLVRRARVILLGDRGVSGREIALRLDLSPEHVSKVRTWFRTGGGTPSSSFDRLLPHRLGQMLLVWRPERVLARSNARNVAPLLSVKISLAHRKSASR
jgi:Homeodomain-like domain-containing protein